MERNEYITMAAVEDHHWWYRGMRAISAALIDEVYQAAHNLAILDAGAGTGGNARFLRHYGRVTALDLAPEARELGGPRVGGRFVSGSVLELPFADRQFDLVTSFDVLYHRAVPSEAEALAEVRRVLRPDGHLLIRLPAYEFLRGKHDRAVHTRRRYTAHSMQQILQANGFTVVRWSYALSTLFPLALLQRLLDRLRPGDAPSADSDLALPNPLFNQLMGLPLQAEAALLRAGGRLPFGLSVVAIARQSNRR